MTGSQIIIQDPITIFLFQNNFFICWNNGANSARGERLGNGAGEEGRRVVAGHDDDDLRLSCVSMRDGPHEVDSAADLVLCQPKHRVHICSREHLAELASVVLAAETNEHVCTEESFFQPLQCLRIEHPPLADRRRFGLAARVAGTDSCCGVRCLRFARSSTPGPPHVHVLLVAVPSLVWAIR